MKKQRTIVSTIIMLILILALTAAADAAYSPPSLRVMYVQATASGSLSSIPATAWQYPNVMVFAFESPGNTNYNPAILSVMETAMANEGPGTINLLSFGGSSSSCGAANLFGNTSAAAANMVALVNSYNSALATYSNNNSKYIISGIDLDLESNAENGNYTSTTITTLAQTLKQLNSALLISIAPQVTTTAWPTDGATYSNIEFTSGTTAATRNEYNAVLTSKVSGTANSVIDYMFLQCYNSGSGTISVNYADPNSSYNPGGGAETYAECDEGFFLGMAALLKTCQTNGVILSNTKIAIGEPSNQCAAGVCALFNPTNAAIPSGSYNPYNQAQILGWLQQDIGIMQANTATYGDFGIMTWSINNDYDPTAWSDKDAVAGNFNLAIFAGKSPLQGSTN